MLERKESLGYEKEQLAFSDLRSRDNRRRMRVQLNYQYNMPYRSLTLSETQNSLIVMVVEF